MGIGFTPGVERKLFTVTNRIGKAFVQEKLFQNLASHMVTIETFVINQTNENRPFRTVCSTRIRRVVIGHVTADYLFSEL